MTEKMPVITVGQLVALSARVKNLIALITRHKSDIVARMAATSGHNVKPLKRLPALQRFLTVMLSRPHTTELTFIEMCMLKRYLVRTQQHLECINGPSFICAIFDILDELDTFCVETWYLEYRMFMSKLNKVDIKANHVMLPGRKIIHKPEYYASIQKW